MFYLMVALFPPGTAESSCSSIQFSSVQFFIKGTRKWMLCIIRNWGVWRISVFEGNFPICKDLGLFHLSGLICVVVGDGGGWWWPGLVD